MKKIFKVIYILPSHEHKNGRFTGVALVEGRDKAEASHNFKEMGIAFHTIDRIEEM